MRHLFLIIFLIALLPYGCSKQERAVIQIDDISISKEEYLQAYRASPFYGQKDADPKAFLEHYISKKIILREAERSGLDRDPQFLADIQQYWEQGLMKQALSQKHAQMEAGVVVNDAEINHYFGQQKDTIFAQKTLEEAKPQIREFLIREKQKEALQEWVRGLRQKTKIKIDFLELGIN